VALVKYDEKIIEKLKDPGFATQQPFFKKAPPPSPSGVVNLVVSSPPATEETGAMGREIESRQSIGG
jgi:hypothetical protein